MAAFRFGVNIDHVATIRRLRDTPYPSVLDAAREVIAGGADQITIHLREDRRHITDRDVEALREEINVDLNLEMAATEEMLSIALARRPYSICIVPEKREERTTEGGLDLSCSLRRDLLKRITHAARDQGIVVSYFIEPSPKDLQHAYELGAQAVELHTGSLCHAFQSQRHAEFEDEWRRLLDALPIGEHLGLIVNAGHGIDYELAPRLGALSLIHEYNIGHSIVARSVFCGLREATRQMRQALLQHRK